MNSSEREITVSELVTPEMANFHGKLHGGELLSLADKAAYVCASRYSGKYCVTASFDRVDFHEPVEVGELLVFLARVIGVGNSSMMVEIDVTAEDMAENTRRDCATCHVTMVAVDEEGTVEVPGLQCETMEEHRQCLRALRRNQLSREYKRKIQQIDDEVESMEDDEVLAELEEHGKL